MRRCQSVQHVLWCGAGLKLFRHPAIERSAMPVACFHEWLDIVGVAAALQESRAGSQRTHDGFPEPGGLLRGSDGVG